MTGDVRLSDLHDKRSFAVFLPVSQRTRTADPLHLLLRRHGGQPVGELDVRKAVEGAGQYRVLRLRMLADQVARAFVRERVMAAFGAFFAALTALLVAVGAYASLAFAVRVRRRELGVRLALGASPGGTLRMVVRRGLGLALVGLGAGLPAAVYVGRLLQEQLFDVRVTDPAVLGSVAVFVLGLSIAASLGPARRAAHIDPATALRAM